MQRPIVSMRAVLKITLKQQPNGLRQTKVSELSHLSEIKSKQEGAADVKIKHKVTGVGLGAVLPLR
jgi:hypothetical protein